MHTNLAYLALPLAPVLALALACTLEITDFKESASTSATSDPDDTTSDSESSTSAGASTSGSTADPNDTTSEGTTSAGTTADVTTENTSDGDDFPACHAYTQDPQAGDAEACAAELGCADFDESVGCQAIAYYNEDTESGVECRWGGLLSGVYIEAEESCDGDIQGVCRAAVFLGEGGPPCSGFYRDFGGSLEVLNLNCGTPIAGGWEACYVDGGDPEFPACTGCFPPLP